MSKIHLLSKEDRQAFFEEAVITSGIALPIIEKDFWVVWTLERLFSLAEINAHLTFKGGTSLSKVYKLIERFSEDIDVSIEKDVLGFGAAEKDPANAKSRKKRNSVLEALAAKCASYVQDELAPALGKSISDALGTHQGWQLIPDSRDPQALSFEYPNISPRGGYVHQAIKIEMGARSEHWPVADHKIESLVKTALKDKVTESDFTIRVLKAERTFWEKATILHQYAQLPEGKNLPPRISRHFYDFFKLLDSPIKESALSDLSLLERVVEHKSVYFSSAWAKYETARKGTLKISPLDRLLPELEADYDRMEAMFYGPAPRPSWRRILQTLDEFEKAFNAPSGDGVDAAFNNVAKKYSRALKNLAK
jgi:predicted nucleotidyltransferase component of viral defense system